MFEAEKELQKVHSAKSLKYGANCLPLQDYNRKRCNLSESESIGDKTTCSSGYNSDHSETELEDFEKNKDFKIEDFENNGTFEEYFYDDEFMLIDDNTWDKEITDELEKISELTHPPLERTVRRTFWIPDKDFDALWTRMSYEARVEQYEEQYYDTKDYCMLKSYVTLSCRGRDNQWVSTTIDISRDANGSIQEYEISGAEQILALVPFPSLTTRKMKTTLGGVSAVRSSETAAIENHKNFLPQEIEQILALVPFLSLTTRKMKTTLDGVSATFENKGLGFWVCVMQVDLAGKDSVCDALDHVERLGNNCGMLSLADLPPFK